MTEARVREEIAGVCARLASRGYVANHDGNVSTRLTPSRLLVTPTSTHKERVRAGDLVVTDASGRKLSGRLNVPSEFAAHLAVYKLRADVGAVVHAHPPYATALGVSGRELVPFLPEAVVSLGTRIPLVALTLPGAPMIAAMEPFVAKFDAVMVSANGVWAWGDDVEQAFCRLELVEHLCRIASYAAQWGGPQPLGAEIIEPMLAARKRAFPNK